LAIAETYQPPKTKSTSLQGSWAATLRDRRLLVYVLVNIIFTPIFPSCTALCPSTSKLCVVGVGQGLAETTISALFAWHLALAIACQLPVARALKRFSHAQGTHYFHNVGSGIQLNLGYGCCCKSF